MKKCIYTCITGAHDALKQPQLATAGWDYICYSDVLPVGREGHWQVRRTKKQATEVRTARWHKTHPPEGYDRTIWLDASIHIMCDLDKFTQRFAKLDFVLMEHPGWQCVYREAQVCVMLGKDKADMIHEQVGRYAANGYPKNNGMVATGFMFRRDTETNKRFNEEWWNEIDAYSHRDQLSFNYLASKLKLDFTMIPYYDTIQKQDFRIEAHARRPRKVAN